MKNNILTPSVATPPHRIEGYDVARGLAVFIMIFVNFEMVLAEKTMTGIYHAVFDFMHGKGAAMFVVLAGVGISLMVKPARVNNDRQLLWTKQLILLKRAVFLFVFGLLYLPLWPADILHFYGFFISIGAWMAASRSKWLWITFAILVFSYPFILTVIDYETGWNWIITEYTDFWTPTGFVRNLLINGFHPVIPWLAFVLAGLWLGRQNLYDKRLRRKILLSALFVVIVLQFLSTKSIQYAVSNHILNAEDALSILGTTPMPPMPFYMIYGTAFSFLIIILCIIFTERYAGSKYLKTLVVTGQMAFTHYVGHIVIGMMAIYLWVGENACSVGFIFGYAFFYSVASILFSYLWRKRYKRGPMSILMRKITG